MSTIRDSEGYCLRLADGQQWRFVATDGTGPFVDRMAQILSLQICDQYDGIKMIFIRGNNDGRVQTGLDCAMYPEFCHYPADGWSIKDMGYVRIWTHCDVQDIICEIIDRDERDLDYNNIRFIDIWRIAFSLDPVYNKVLSSGGTVMHTAMFELNGKGALISAKSGTGKSTCFKRIGTPWQAISDEEVLVVRAGDRYLIHPMPTWSDYVERGLDYPRDVQWHIPLSGIFFLEQSQKDEAIPLGKGDAALKIYNSSEQLCYKYIVNLKQEERLAFRKRLLDNAIELSRQVPAFTLRATLTGRFWDEMEKVLV